MHFDKEFQTFLKDQDIEDAYQVLKPVFDKLHEDFITKSLESDKAKELDISEYLKQYRTRQELKKKKSNEKEQVKKERIQKEIDKITKLIEEIEKNLRKEFDYVYEETGDEYKLHLTLAKSYFPLPSKRELYILACSGTKDSPSGPMIVNFNRCSTSTSSSDSSTTASSSSTSLD